MSAVVGFALLASACGSDPDSGDVTTANEPTVVGDETTVDEVKATLVVDTEECRNGGSLDSFDRTWVLAEAVPFDWQDLVPIDGTVRVRDEQNLIFTARGVGVRVTTGDTLAECVTWVED